MSSIQDCSGQKIKRVNYSIPLRAAARDLQYIIQKNTELFDNFE
jgi:hypothetical protein